MYKVHGVMDGHTLSIFPVNAGPPTKTRAKKQKTKKEINSKSVHGGLRSDAEMKESRLTHWVL